MVDLSWKVSNLAEEEEVIVTPPPRPPRENVVTPYAKIQLAAVKRAEA